MKVLILVVLVAAVVNGQVGVINRSGYNKDHPGKCFFTESTRDKPIEKVLEFDEIFRPIGVCVKTKCRSDVVLDLFYCQRFNHVVEGCEVIKEDLTKEWPQCCEKLKCKDGIREITTEVV